MKPRFLWPGISRDALLRGGRLVSTRATATATPKSSSWTAVTVTAEAEVLPTYIRTSVPVESTKVMRTSAGSEPIMNLSEGTSRAQRPSMRKTMLAASVSRKSGPEGTDIGQCTTASETDGADSKPAPLATTTPGMSRNLTSTEPTLLDNERTSKARPVNSQRCAPQSAADTASGWLSSTSPRPVERSIDASGGTTFDKTTRAGVKTKLLGAANSPWTS